MPLGNSEWGMDWVNDPPWGLNHFLWSTQPPEFGSTIARYLSAWKKYILDVSEEEKFYGYEKPAPIIHLYGPNNTGKTEIICRGIARFMIYNLGFKSFQYVHWATYVKATLDREPIDVNLDARFIILDDIDGRRPVPKSGSTWLLDDMSAFLKNRKYPMLITSNRVPEQLVLYLATPVEGKVTDDVKQSAKTVVTAIGRKSFASLEARKSTNGGPLVNQNETLRLLALKQDFYALFPREINGKEAIY